MLGFPKSKVWIKMGFLKKFKCEKCDLKFSQEEELMQHSQIVHYKDYPYDCKECNKSYQERIQC